MSLLLKSWVVKNLSSDVVPLTVDGKELLLAPHGELWITSRDPRPALAGLIEAGVIEVVRDG